MTPTDIERQIVDVLRETSLVPEHREVSLAEPLGELGLVDSLGLVEFVTAVEVKFQVELPETIWTDREELTLQRIIDAVSASGSESPAVPTRVVQTDAGVVEASPSEQADSNILKVRRAIQERGFLRGTAWVFTRFAGLFKRLTYVQENQFLLEIDLRQDLPSHRPSIDVVIREATSQDVPLLSEFFSAFGRAMSAELLQHRMENGFTCFVALHNDELVGMTWNSEEGEDNCPFTGLDFKMLPGSCYGLDLYEHERYTGNGVGLALLSHSLAAAKARGFEKQITSVDVTNTKMLTAAVHLTGFERVGSIRTVWLFRRPHSTWVVGERRGRGGSVTL